MPPADDARPPVAGSPLRIALLTYRGNPYSGGQGVYIRHLSAALARLGHRVTVFSGQPYPELVDGVTLERVPSLDLYRADDPFRTPRLHEFRDWIDALEYGTMATAGFPEPLTFSLRIRRILLERRGEFDVVHDNQGLGWGLLALVRAGIPVVATLHHAVVIDRDLEVARRPTRKTRLIARRWYHFTAMQARVARRLPRLIAPTELSMRDLVTLMRLDRSRIDVVPIAVDHAVFSPLPEVRREPGRIFAIASADVPLKGIAPLAEAVARLRRERDDVRLVLLTRPRGDGVVHGAIRRFGVDDAVEIVSNLDDAEVARQYALAHVAVVPSLYEGFSIPAVQALASGTPLVCTTAGALPEVAGRDGDTALLVPPGDAASLATAIGRVLDDPALAAHLGDAGRRHALERFGWERTAAETVAVYRSVLGDEPPEDEADVEEAIA